MIFQNFGRGKFHFRYLFKVKKISRNFSLNFPRKKCTKSVKSRLSHSVSGMVWQNGLIFSLASASMPAEAMAKPLKASVGQRLTQT
jgi:hypothetical protein